jgi:hypothetical protein
MCIFTASADKDRDYVIECGMVPVVFLPFASAKGAQMFEGGNYV